jgi:tellurite resistance protein TehA-like permease
VDDDPYGASATGMADSQARPLGWPAAAIRDLHPGHFTGVMATGIISTGAFLLGPAWLSRALLVLACAGLVVLMVAMVIRLIRFRPSVIVDARAPDRVFGFFEVTAALNVVGVRLWYAGHPVATAILAGLSAAVWLVLTYAVPARVLLARPGDWVAVAAWVLVAAALLAQLARRPTRQA